MTDVYTAIFDARLAGGTAANNGIVEVLTDDGWLPVCYSNATFPSNDEFGMFSWDSHTESKVLCRQLGYGHDFVFTLSMCMALFHTHLS